MSNNYYKRVIENLKEELSLANKEVSLQNEETEKRAAEKVIANKELSVQNKEKIKSAAELQTANKEISAQAMLLKIQEAYFIDKQLLERTLESIGDAVISTDLNKNVVFLNKVAQSVTGWTQEEACGETVYNVFNIINEHTRKRENDIIEQVMESGTTHMLANHTILTTKDGKEVLIEDSAAPILNERSKCIGVVIVFRDYSERWERLKRIEYLSFHDDLTGLYNRRFYEEDIKRIDTKRNLPLSLIMGDVNGLKLINDSFGHKVGDELLTKAAEVIKQICRSDDIAARLGGDEFVIALPKTNAIQAAEVITRIKQRLSLERINGLEISISFGYETKTDDNQDFGDIFKNTENHMYRHKIYESSSMRSETINLVKNALFAKNLREHIHSETVSQLCVTLSEKMGFDEDGINQMRLAGLMHDIGKIGIADNILNKLGKLDAYEYAEIKKHPEIGYRILRSVNEFSEISDFVLQHQEKWDGTGYPQGLKGEKIKIEARMIAVADSYDAMTTQRTYSTARNQKDALNELTRCSGTQFDPGIVKIFVEQVIKQEECR